MMGFSQPTHQMQLQFPQSSGDDSNNDHNSKVLSNHQDYIHYISFDVYGRRMATCSGDRFVRVWDLTDSGDWSLVGEWQAHRGNVTRIAWAHPEFGSVLGTCGTDSDAKIWEERTHASVLSGVSSNTTASAAAESPDTPLQQPAGTVAGTGTNALASRWTIKTQLTEASKAVTCLEFAPRHWGLKLATGSADGCVRIYEAVDVMNLAHWPLAATLQTSDDFGVEEDNEIRNICEVIMPLHLPHNKHNPNSQLGVLCLSWCTGRFEPPTLVVGGSQLSIFRYMEAAQAWQPILQLPLGGNQSDLQILDVSWAPNVGRSFHYIASAEGQQLRVYTLSRPYTNASDTTTAQSSSKPSTAINNDKLEVESSQTLVANASRCQWNVTGTVLASSGDSGTVQMWKADRAGNFQCVAQVQGDLTQAAGAMIE